jgi:hypothetical protein
VSSIPFNRSRNAPLTPEITKRLPSNHDAERNILGAILLDNAVLKAVREVVIAANFHVREHEKIFLQMVILADAGKPIDLVTLTEELMSASQLEAAGGAAYLASLADGMPRISNIKYYAEIVKEKSRLRDLVHLTENIQQNALEGSGKPEELAAQIEAFSKHNHTSENPAVLVGFKELLTLDLPPAEFVIEPLLTIGGSGMMYGWTGTGKSYIATEMATRIALGLPKLFEGGGFTGWPVTRPYRVLYVYGEMHGAMIKNRVIEIAKGHNLLSKDEQLEHLEQYFGLLSKDFQKIKRAPANALKWRPRISGHTDRKYVEDLLARGEYEILILDNLSTLWPASQEGESDMAAVLQDWFTDLNQKGIAVFFLHHAGKGGDQIGASSKEHILDFTLRLKRPGDYQQEEQLRVQVEIEKIRNECKNPAWLAPFEISLRTDENGAEWLTRPMKDAQLRMAFERFAAGMKPNDVWLDLGLKNRYVAIRLHNKFKDNQDAKHWTEE